MGDSAFEQKNYSFITSVSAVYPQFIIKPSARFSFRAPHTIYCNLNDPDFTLLFLHELGHALLGHTAFKTDIDRVKMESAAWNKAKSLCKEFDIPYDEDFAEDQLDTYRNWLHSKSLCKKCGLTRYQTPDGKYHCPHCE